MLLSMNVISNYGILLASQFELSFIELPYHVILCLVVPRGTSDGVETSMHLGYKLGAATFKDNTWNARKF